MDTMTSNKPYLLRAFHQWIVDNGLTPYLMVDARIPGVDVPASAVDGEGRVVFNIAHRAVHGLEMGNEYIVFDARFSGASYPVTVPVAAVMAIYARENGAGTLFEVEQPQKGAAAEPAQAREQTADPEQDNARKQPGRGGLRLVKD